MNATPKRPGISETTLISAGIRLSDYPEPGSIEIPYWLREGEITPFKRYRLPVERPDGQKYYQEPGSGVYAYFPPGFFRRNGDNQFGLAADYVILVEGEFKALSLLELGVYTIGLPSFFVYQKDQNGYRRLLDDLRQIFDRERIRTIYFIGDSDTATNFEFSRSAAFLARNAWQAQVFLPRLPFGGAKGIDDAKEALGEGFGAFFAALIRDAIPLERKCDETALALLLLEREAKRISALEAVAREKQNRRIERMVALAQALGATGATARLRKVAAKIIGINVSELKAAIKTEQVRYRKANPPQRAATARESKTELILPGHHVEFRESGRIIFEQLAKTWRYFVRDRIVFELIKDGSGARLVELDPEAFRSQLEEYFRLRTWRAVSGKLHLLDGRCSVSDATALLRCDPAWQLLPPIQLITGSPVFIERNSALEILGKGYHSLLGGIYIWRDYHISDVPLADAINVIKSLAKDFLFVAESDRSRFLASLLAPSLRFGGLITDDFPLFVNEADKSQAGKTYAHKVLCRIYNERPYTVTLNEERNAPGSHDEKLSKGLIEARPFIMWENARGLVSSQLAESAIRGTGLVTCRIAYSAPVEIQTGKVMWLLSSNKASVTPDLAARSLITRIRKQPDDYEFHKFADDRDLLEEVQYNGAYYLSCILAVLREWIARGKPRTSDRRHDFTEACQSLDWIGQHVLKLAPLLDDHQNEQDRVSNPLFNWLRDVALVVEKSENLENWLRASEIAEICAEHDVFIPQCREAAGEKIRNQTIGRLFKHLFKDAQTIAVSGFTISRKTFDEYNSLHQENVPVTRHCFEK